MGIINVLDFATANLIAAGEVAERPCSVVKELIENSVDAGATRITVEIRGGGVKMIRVTDNGQGMSRDDLKRCILRHATSKIKTGKDLSAICSLGFRGEALAATAAVSRMTITTRQKSDQTAYSMNVRYGSAEEPREAAGAPGTTVTVTDLFSNVPARLKFLKQDKSEASAVLSVCEKAALASPAISFRVLSDGIEKLNTSGDGKLKNAAYAVMGRLTAQNMTAVSGSVSGVTVTGLIASPQAARSNRAWEIFFINGRHVKSPVLQSALETALKNFTPKDRFPVCILDIALHPSAVDVNVHPSKQEVKFSSDKAVFDAVYFAVSSSCTEGMKRPEFEPLPKGLDAFEEVGVRVTREQTTAFDAPAPQIASGGAALRSLNADEIFGINENEKIAAAPVFPQIQREAEISHPRPAPAEAAAPGGSSAPADIKEEELPKAPSGRNEASQPPEPKAPRPVPQYNFIGEGWNTYLFVQTEDKILIIDKHAAHERIIFEDLKKGLKGQRTVSQVLMLPLDIALSAEERANGEIFACEIDKCGFSLDIDNGRLYEYPAFLSAREATELLHTLLAALPYGREAAEEKRLEVFEKALYQSCCKGAVKGGERNTPLEIKAIIERLLTDPSVSYCPHGRPVLFEMLKSSVERRFGRE